MRMTDIIEKKRDKTELSEKEIEFFVTGATNGSIPDYQISALLMAILLNGMSHSETVFLTLAMAKSGDLLDLSALGERTVDKHSTGGVGDKTTLVVAPIAAALGCTVAKMSGRGLGHTGGTIDKLESISGYRTTLSPEEFISQSKKYHMCVIGQSGNLAPADKKLYALRDVTGTVKSIPLIASSIMSKKLAAGAKNILLDVKFGSGAFMKTPEEAEKLAALMVEIGKNAGRNTAALITNMDIPLGYAVGNSLEVDEAVSVLRGDGPGDLTELCVALACEMYGLSFGKAHNECVAAVKQVIDNGSAYKALLEAVKAQGGDEKLLTGEKKFPAAEASYEIRCENDGFVRAMNTELIGKAACLSGAGRETVSDKIDFSAGVILSKKYGEAVKKGETLAFVCGKKERLPEAAETLLSAYEIGNEKPENKPLIYKTIN